MKMISSAGLNFRIFCNAIVVSVSGTLPTFHKYVIITANNRPVATQAELDAQVKAVSAQGRSAILLQVLRRGQPAVFLPVRLRDK